MKPKSITLPFCQIAHVFAFVCIVSPFACHPSQEEKTRNSSPPKIIDVKGKVISSDRISPIAFPVGESEIITTTTGNPFQLPIDFPNNEKAFYYFKNKIGLDNDMVKYIGGESSLCNPRSVFADKNGNIWFASIGGVGRYDGKTISYFTEKEGLCYNVVNDIMQAKNGDMWFVTGNGKISRYDGKRFYNYKTNGNAILSCHQDRSGNFWFGSFDGVRCFDGKNFLFFTFIKDVNEIVEDKNGVLWFASEQNGIASYDYKTVTRFTNKEGLCSNNVLSLLEDKNGNLWIGTTAGVAVYNGKNSSVFTTAQGLANDSVNSILQDKEGNIWLGTNNGLSKMSAKNVVALQQANDPDSSWFQTFAIADGIKSGLFQENCVAEDKRGNIWWGTSNGVLFYNFKKAD